MNDSNFSNLTHIDLDNQRAEFLGGSFNNGERHLPSGVGNNQNIPEFGVTARMRQGEK